MNWDSSDELWWYVYKSGGLSGVGKSPKKREIKGCGATFLRLGPFGGGYKEGVYQL